MRAVNDISFTIEPGSALALVGESGCGKTTTLRMVVGLGLMALAYVGTLPAWAGYIGVIPLATGLVGACPLYRMLGVSTCTTQ